jgi:probable rRNA maturation factor
MIFIKIIPEFKQDIRPALLEHAAQATLQNQADPDVDLTLVFTNDRQIQALNRDYIGKDTPTDVLSFLASETDPETGRQYLGDVIISVPRAKEQSAAAGHSLDEELALLVVHGVLHLLGHDHASTEEKECMWAYQTDIMTQLGFPQFTLYG